jgi:signal transduction histidine kinase
MMFKQLRFRLFLLIFLSVMVTLVGLGLGANYLLRTSFEQAVDSRVKYRLALEYRAMGLNLPPDLLNAEKNSSQSQTTGQDMVLAQARTNFVLLGGLTGLLWLGLAWWLSGRSIAPAERAWEQQRIFIANASHELRTPLTLIRASVEIAQRQTINLQHRTLLADVLADCDYMNRLVEDLLTLSRLDNQRLILNPEPVHLSRFLPEIGAQVDKLAVRKEVYFSVEPGDAVGDAVVKVDPARLKQVLLILLDNAFRYTPAGGSVLLSAETVEERVNISVSDSGVGIAPEHLPHVFERFYKLDPPQDEEYRGSGLGLSIAKSLVEAQGGTIRLDSEAGKGTRAMITFQKEREYAEI